VPHSPVYLDCNATTPLDERVRQVMCDAFADGPSNAGSRTHEFGLRASRTVERAREAVARVVNAAAEEVVFTSGATESNNLAILGLAEHADRTGCRHVICSAIEHKAVLEPVDALRRRGFTVSVLPSSRFGQVNTGELRQALTDRTLLVSIMHVNNETGVLQPLREVAQALSDHPAYLHVDAAQGYGKELDQLRLGRLDLISVSGHKIFGPPGVGALIARRRNGKRPPLSPVLFGGGQERGLRPGTLPVSLIAGLGEAARLALEEHDERQLACLRFRSAMLQRLAPLKPRLVNGASPTLPHVASLSFGSIESEAVMLALKHLVAISNGSACTSASYSPSHVLAAMGLEGEEIASVTRWSWCHETPAPDWDAVVEAVHRLF